MEVFHFSAECYPAAKAGGLGDVVGSLPKYFNRLDSNATVVMPAYQTEWLVQQPFEIVFKSQAPLGDEYFEFEVRHLYDAELGFPLYTIHIPGRFDRAGIYVDPESGHGYWDELERFVSFQIAALDWVKSFDHLPDLFHCHDHHTALIPFMMTQCYRYDMLASKPTLVTIHNGQYHGEHHMNKYHLLPPFDLTHAGLLEWNDKLNSLATGIKCAWMVSTVSQSYMKELSVESKGLEDLIASEWQKTTGVVNGIDVEVWDPARDPLIEHNFTYDELEEGKTENKKILCQEFDLDPTLPTISFIGRLVAEKGADLLPNLINHFGSNGENVNFIILGTGEPSLHKVFNKMKSSYVGFFDARLEYNEKLAHQIYAGSDFMIMPSRVEPCGLNQMYAMRYATVPIVRAIGGLKDTVIDIDDEDGYGITFSEFSLDMAVESVERSINFYEDQEQFRQNRKKLVSLDFSWERSAQSYKEIYERLINKT